MVAAKFWKKKVLLAKIETVYKTDPTLTGAANAILATDVSIQPMEGEDVSRNLDMPHLGAQESIVAAERVVLSFSTELSGSGAAGTAPGWGPLMRGCAFAETIVADTSVTYNPISAAMESLWIKLWIDGVLHVLMGARGTAELALDAQGIPKISWTFTGLFVTPADTANATPILSGFIKPLIASNANTPTFTLNAVAMVLRSYKLNFGNDVQPRLLVGKEEILIVDRAETLNVQVEATPMATLNPFSLAKAGTRVPVSIVHGTSAGNIITIGAPTCQVNRPTGLENNQNIVEWPLGLVPLPNAGNDQFSIALT